MLKPTQKPLWLLGAAFLLLASFLLNSCASAPKKLTSARRNPGSNALRQSLSKVSRHGLRVLLRRGEKNLHLSAPHGLQLLDPSTGNLLAEFGSGQKGSLSAEHGHLKAGGKTLDSSQAELKPLASSGQIGVMGLHYRGRLILIASENDLLLVNEVPLDSYLYGVLPSEVQENWPMEALKAQAVAARTYALFRVNSADSPLFDLDDSTRSQVYLGTSKEGKHSRQAVDATTGLVLTYKDHLVQAFFHANCGGHTADSRNVWGDDLPYLHGVDDSFCEDGTHATWQTSIDHQELLEKLRKAGHKISDFDYLDLQGQDKSGRWKTVHLKGDGVDLTLGASAFRSALGADTLRSTNFKWKRRGDRDEFSGHGWGHGIGLCQEGAEGMARQGYSFHEILTHYFPQTHIKKLD